MSLSSPYGQDGGQSPLGGPSTFGTQNWGNWQPGAVTGGGSFSPSPQPQPQQPAPQTDVSEVQSGGTNLPPWAGGDLGNTTQSTTGGPGNMMQPVVGASQAPVSGVSNLQPIIGGVQGPSPGGAAGPVTGAAQGPVNMMVNALASPTSPPQNPASFAPTTSLVAAPTAAPPANPLSFLGASAPSSVAAPASQAQSPYGF